MILIGTSGYSFPDWVGPFYPEGTTRAQMLDYYVKQFPAVEVNATYYRIPPPGTLAAMERKTPPGFEFVVKTNAGMTHEGSTDPALYDSLRRAVEPVARAGKLTGYLAQFPWAFRPGARAEEHLRLLKRLLPEAPLFVEFRHRSWITDQTFRFLEEEGLHYVSVDEPDLPGLVPPLARTTGDLAYVRLHGRNKENWWASARADRAAAAVPAQESLGLFDNAETPKPPPPVRRVAAPPSSDRYDYLYSEQELREWAEKIRDLAMKSKKTFVFFNNCHVGQAATGAKLMRRLLEGP
ncbi:MAG TPA: DUF72 domain-containing protein [Candidatus Eisenbacteria bacterium]|jgi:uncharacterized protein YecE (DUF72 family)